MIAIGHSIDLLFDKATPGATCAILTDSQSSLRALESGPKKAREDFEHKLWKGLHRLAGNNINLILHYVPSHVQVLGNDAADAAAAEGTKMVQSPGLSFSAARSCARRHLANTPSVEQPGTNTVYARKAGADVAVLQPPVHCTDLTRRGETTIRSLRAGSNQLTFDFRTSSNTATCLRCDKPCTLKHLFFSCRQTCSESLPDLHTLLMREPATALKYLVSESFPAWPA